MMKAYRQFLWVAFLLAPLLWLVWPSADKAGSEKDSQAAAETERHYSVGRVRGEDVDGASEANPRRVRGARDLSSLTGVDRILADDAISDREAALRLRELALNSTNSVEDRLEALQHGLNLHPDSFADFAQQKDLPAELASHYLDEIINHDDSPAVQIRAYMALMDHPDAEVADLAKEMLALEVGDEERQSSREKLLVVGQSKLAKLASAAE